MNRPTIPHILAAGLLALYVITAPVLALAMQSWTPIWLGFSMWLGAVLSTAVIGMIREHRRPPATAERVSAAVHARLEAMHTRQMADAAAVQDEVNEHTKRKDGAQ